MFLKALSVVSSSHFLMGQSTVVPDTLGSVNIALFADGYTCREANGAWNTEQQKTPESSLSAKHHPTYNFGVPLLATKMFGCPCTAIVALLPQVKLGRENKRCSEWGWKHPNLLSWPLGAKIAWLGWGYRCGVHMRGGMRVHRGETWQNPHFPNQDYLLTISLVVCFFFSGICC